MPRPTINPTDEFYQAVSDYQKQHNLPSWSQAVLKLAQIGLTQETGQDVKAAKDEWGGARSGDLERYVAIVQERYKPGYKVLIHGSHGTYATFQVLNKAGQSVHGTIANIKESQVGDLKAALEAVDVTVVVQLHGYNEQTSSKEY